MSDVPEQLGIVGAGTMGAGIAQLGALAGIRTVMFDPVEGAVERASETISKNLDKGAERGRWSSDEADAARGRLAASDDPEAIGDCELVVEAAPERFDLKRQLFEQLAQVCGPDTVLASNTSSIPITRIAGVTPEPERVVGLHFFNPAPLMKLVELIPALQSGDAAVAKARALGEAMGKRVIQTIDGPGFLVNRCGRPFGSEALRLLQEGLATVEQIDQLYRDGGGYRMGPFELMDLVGIDVGYEVAQSFMELSFGEPRWKPSPLQAQMVAAGRLGRKSGRGWYEYGSDSSQRDSEPPPRADELLDRVQCCIVNEGVFALGEGVGSANDIDDGTKLGLNWPKGPLELGQELGFDHVRATMDALFERYHEERYRAAPLLRDGVRLG